MDRRAFLGRLAGVSAAIGVGAVGTATAADSQLEPGTWYDATVTDVTDGDTIDVVLDSDGTEYEVRVLGVDTPETKRNGKYEDVAEWEGIEDDKYLSRWGENAKAYAQDLFPDGTAVQVAVDEQEDEIDPFGRLLAYIRYDADGDGTFDTLYNRRLLELGYARVYGSSLTKHDDFWAAEDAAQADGRRVWTRSDPASTSEVDDEPVSEVFFPKASSVRTDAGAIADARVPVYAESTATQDLASGGVSYDRIPLVGVDESLNLALVGGLSINEEYEDTQAGQHEAFLTNLLDYLGSANGQVLIDGGHGQFNAERALSSEDAVYYQRYLEGQDLAFEQVNTLDGTGGNALSTARAIVITPPHSAFTTSEVDALSTFVSNGGSVLLLGSALASDGARANLDQLAADLGSDLRLNADQVFDDANALGRGRGDSSLFTTSAFDTGFPLFSAYT